MEWLSMVIMEYEKYIHHKSDPRTSGYFFVSSPFQPFFIVLCYMYFSWNVKSLTKKLRAFNLKGYVICYNAVMVVFSAYLTIEIALAAYAGGYSLYCQPVDYSFAPSSERIARAVWLYYFSKYIEMTETVVFALRKKYEQITLLHVYHHTTMLIFSWLAVKYAAGGQAYIFGTINSFVHTVMYLYYGLSACGPQVRKYLWWKKYITILQLSQFIILFFYCIRSVVIDCGYPKAICFAMVPYSVTLFFLFMKFYLQAYSRNKKQTNGKVAAEAKKQD